MVHPNVENYQRVLSSDLDPGEAAQLLAEDVRWYEAGNPEPIVGRDAVLARMSSFPGDAPPEIQVDAIFGDDDHLVVAGRAHFRRGEQTLDYRFVEVHTLLDGKVTERRAFMDAVPDDVATFFNG